MPITDNRILIADAESLAPGSGGDWVDEADGTMSLSLDTDTFIEGVSAIGDRASSSRIGIGWREDADRDWSNSVFYIWWNCVVANKLGTKENAGITMRFTGATVTDWFEVYIDGSDTYSGGFKMSVVDIEEARALAVTGAAQSPNLVGNTNGTPPATSAIRRVIIMFDVLTTSPGSADNCFVDAIWRLPIGEPGVIVSGTNTAASPTSTPWTWADVLAAGDNSDPTKAWGVISEDSGVLFLNTPVQFGNNGSPDDGDHDFEDTNIVIAWEDQLVADDFYGFKVVGDPVNSQRFVAGVKSGVVGTQGWVITESFVGARWFLDAEDITSPLGSPESNIQEMGLYGCLLTRMGSNFLDDPNIEILDGQSLNSDIIYLDGVTANGFQLLGSSDPDGAVRWDELSTPNIQDALSFTSDGSGHAIHINPDNPTSPQDLVYDMEGYSFSGYAGSPLIGDSGDEVFFVDPEPDDIVLVDSSDLQTSDAFDLVGSPSIYDFVVHEFNGDVEEGDVVVVIFPTNVNPGEGASLVRFGAGSPVQQPFVASPEGKFEYSRTLASSTVITHVMQVGYVPAWSTGIVTNRTGGVHSSAFITRVYRGVDPDFPFDPSLDINQNSPRYYATNTGMSVQAFDDFPTSLKKTLVLQTAATTEDLTVDSPLNGWEIDTILTDTAVSPNSAGSVALVTKTFADPTPVISRDDVIFRSTTNRMVFRVIGLAAKNDRNITVNAVNVSGVLSRRIAAGYNGTFTINNNVSVTLTNIIPGTEVRVYPVESPINTTEIAGVESVGSPNEFSFSGEAGLVVDIVVFHIDYVLPPANRFRFTIPSSSTSFPLAQVLDRTYNNP